MQIILKIILFFLLCSSSCLAAILHGTPENYREQLKKLNPGDTLELDAGDYRSGLAIHNMNGTADAPIVIKGKTTPPIFWARSGANTISLLDSSYITIQNLTLEGNHIPGIDGVKSEGHARWTHHITLEDLLIRNHGGVGISSKCTSWGWVIRNNVIIAAGTGLYLGNSDGTDAFFDGLIEYNLIQDSVGYNLQIKHQKVRDTDQASHGTIIRHNVFNKSQFAATGKMARPNVLLGHFPISGPGSQDRYDVYGNFFYDNPSEALFQGEGNIALYNNIFVNPHGSAIHIQPHNDVPRNILIFANTIVATDTGVSLRGLASGYQQQLYANAIFAPRNQFAGLTPEPTLGSVNKLLQNPLAELGLLDLSPKSGQLAEKLPLTSFSLYPDYDRDFNSRPRKGKYRGAYEGSQTGWLPKLEIKPKVR